MPSRSASNDKRVEIASNYTTYFEGKVMFNNITSIFPVGYIYMSVNDINPSTYFGGTWERWGQGRVPIGVVPENEDLDNYGPTFYTSNLTGGEVEHKITTKELPAHFHYPGNRETVKRTVTIDGAVTTIYPSFVTHLGNAVAYEFTRANSKVNSTQNHTVLTSVPVTPRGSNDSVRTSGLIAKTSVAYGIATEDENHNITYNYNPIRMLPPYITCYMWVRVA